MRRKYEDENLPPVVMPSCAARQTLAGQKALVTGANSGIGEAVALALGKAGADHHRLRRWSWFALTWTEKARRIPRVLGSFGFSAALARPLAPLFRSSVSNEIWEL